MLTETHAKWNQNKEKRRSCRVWLCLAIPHMKSGEAVTRLSFPCVAHRSASHACSSLNGVLGCLPRSFPGDIYSSKGAGRRQRYTSPLNWWTAFKKQAAPSNPWGEAVGSLILHKRCRMSSHAYDTFPAFSCPHLPSPLATCIPFLKGSEEQCSSVLMTI